MSKAEDRKNQDPALTKILNGIKADDQAIVQKLIPSLYEELRTLAHRKLLYERQNHTLNTTALVHEAYIKLSASKEMEWQSQEHFMATAARVMRHLLINYAEQRSALKRGGGKSTLPLDDIPDVINEERAELLLNLDDALERLALFDNRGAKIVEYRFFGGLSQPEIANLLGISERTVRRSWMMAKIWIQREVRITDFLT